MNLLLFLLYALGFSYALFGIIGSLQKKQRALESLFWAAAAALVNTTLLATAMAMLGIYRFWLLLAIQYGEVLIAAFIAARKKVLYAPRAFWARLRSYEFRILPAIILAVAFALYALFPANYMLSGRDQGVYIVHGVHIAQEGAFAYDSDEFLNENWDRYKDIIGLGSTGIYSDQAHAQNIPEYNRYLFGDSFSDPQPGDLTPQFMPGYPAILAVAYDAGGLSALFRVNSVLAVFALLAFYYLIRRFFSSKAACLALLFLALCPAQIWTARITLTEILAQFLFLAACYLISAGWEQERRLLSLLGGALLGFSLLVRIDVYIYGLGLLVCAAYLAVWNRPKFSYLLPAVGSYVFLGIGTAFWALCNVRPYFVDLFRTGSLRLILTANVLLLAFTLLCSLLGRLLNRKRPLKDWMSAIFASRSGAICIAAFFLLAAAYLYFIRPQAPLAEPILDPTSPLWNTQKQIFRSRSLIEFSWYTSITAVLLSIYGLYRYLRNYREKTSTLLILFALCISNLMVYLYDPAISTDHIWASRRWVTVCFPYIFLLAAYGICEIRLPKIKEFWNRAVQGICALAISAFLIYQSQPFLFFRPLHGIAQQYERFADALEDDELYFTNASEYHSTLRFVYGKNVHKLNYYAADRIPAFLDRNGSLYYIAGNSFPSPYTILDPFDADIEFIESYTISSMDLEWARAAYPRQHQEIDWRADLYRVSKKKNPLVTELPLAMFSSNGRLESESSESFIADGSGATLLFGPYIPLKAGNYTVEFSFRLPPGVTHTELATVDFLAAGEEQQFQNSMKLYAADFVDGECTLSLSMALSEDVENLELRVFPSPDVPLEITGITLRK